MTNRIAQHETEGDGIISLRTLEAAIGAIQRTGDVRKGGIKGWIGAIIRWWDQVLPPPGVEFRTDESVLQAHFLASLVERDWRVPYGVDGYQGWRLMNEIKRRREHGISWRDLNGPQAMILAPRRTILTIPTIWVRRD